MNKKQTGKTAKQKLPLSCQEINCGCGSYEEIFGLIDLAAKRLNQIHRDVVKELGITPSQFQVLRLLWEKDKRPFNELASICNCTRATMTGIVDTLAKNGLAKRVPNPLDRRSLLVKLTAKGDNLKKTTPSLETIFSGCCSGLSAEEFALLYTLMKKLTRSLNG